MFGMKKIFLVGSERSGTNLLRVLIGNHSQISAPPPIHLLDLIVNRLQLVHPSQGSESAALARKLETYVNHEFSDWKLALTPEIETLLPELSAVELMDVLYSLKAETDGMGAYFNKDNNLHNYAPGIYARLPEAKFIWIYRNPLDQVASWMAARMAYRTPYAAAHKWQNDQTTCYRLERFYGIQIHRVAYENLIADTAREMARILDFVDLPMEEACAQTSRDNREARRHLLWENLDKPIMRTNFGKYAEQLSEAEIEMVETICKGMMSTLNFEFVTDANYNFGNRFIFAVRNRLSRRKLTTEKGVETILAKKALVRDLF
jgi:hypothetical protein